MRVWGNWNPCMLLMEMQNGIATVDYSMEIPLKFENRTPMIRQTHFYNHDPKEILALHGLLQQFSQ